MTDWARSVTVSFEMTPAEAFALAQFLKRVGFSEFRACAQDNDEAYAMRDAAELVRKALAFAGYEPR